MPTALVVGGAKCVWEDAVAALSMFTPDAYIVINDMMGLWPLRIDYGVTLHGEHIAKYRRRGPGGSRKFQIWSHRRPPHTSGIIDRITPDWQGSSGLFAVKVAMEEGFRGIVGCGIPMIGSQGHVIRKDPWSAASIFHKGWKRHHHEIAPWVRSMSGWTKQQLGAPTPSWLEEMNSAPPDQELVRLLKEKADGRIKDVV